jgi:hypothetical protein
MHLYPIIYSNLIILYMFRTNKFIIKIYHQKVISVHAAYSISHACMGCLAANTIVS